MFLPQSPRWQRAVIVALLIVPLLVIILLSFPVWLSWPWLKQDRRTDVLNLVEKVTDALKAFVAESKDKDDDHEDATK
ncbi:hypothetical protein AB0O34_14480 [Sphaerisporangium sp. NPDC088356]|uniref:hypothetical protein n=1 Tax=Sphaerisporangium sp. NPDC088356 TaxID=3154871 RepID=UPI00343D624A